MNTKLDSIFPASPALARLDRQQRALAEAGCLRIFADKLSGKDADRPELAACLDYLRPGDTLVVPSLDRLSRSLADLIGIITTLRRQGIGFKSLHEALDTALEEQRSEKYRHALIAVVSIGVRAGQLGGTDAWLSSHLVSHA